MRQRTRARSEWYEVCLENPEKKAKTRREGVLGTENQMEQEKKIMQDTKSKCT